MVADPASAAPAPQEVAGDAHSPGVARLAAIALEAQARSLSTPSAESRVEFDRALERAAVATAGEMAVSPLRMTLAWRATDQMHQTAVLTALTQLGAPYRRNTSDPDEGFDCSGLTAFAWGEAGVPLARQSGSQISAADAREEATAMAGDLAQYPGHVMMYLGVPSAFVHASNPENDVELYMPDENRASGFRYGDPTS